MPERKNMFGKALFFLSTKKKMVIKLKVKILLSEESRSHANHKQECLEKWLFETLRWILHATEKAFCKEHELIMDSAGSLELRLALGRTLAQTRRSKGARSLTSALHCVKWYIVSAGCLWNAKTIPCVTVPKNAEVTKPRVPSYFTSRICLAVFFGGRPFYLQWSYSCSPCAVCGEREAAAPCVPQVAPVTFLGHTTKIVPDTGDSWALSASTAGLFPYSQKEK